MKALHMQSLGVSISVSMSVSMNVDCQHGEDIQSIIIILYRNHDSKIKENKKRIVPSHPPSLFSSTSSSSLSVPSKAKQSKV